MKIIVALLFIAFSNYLEASILDACPAAVPRDQYLQVHGDYCYQFVTFRKLTHSAARAECERNGGHLVFVRDQATQNYLYDQLVNTYRDSFDKVWIGLNDIVVENDYEWEDGTKMVYANWADGEGPQSGSVLHNIGHDGKDCVVMDMLTSGRWRELECESSTFLILLSSSETHSFVCQYRAQLLATVIIHVGGEVITPDPGVTVVSHVNVCPAISCTLGCSAVTFVYDALTGCPVCGCA